MRCVEIKGACLSINETETFTHTHTLSLFYWFWWTASAISLTPLSSDISLSLIRPFWCPQQRGALDSHISAHLALIQLPHSFWKLDQKRIILPETSSSKMDEEPDEESPSRIARSRSCEPPGSTARSRESRGSLWMSVGVHVDTSRRRRMSKARRESQSIELSSLGESFICWKVLKNWEVYGKSVVCYGNKLDH